MKWKDKIYSYLLEQLKKDKDWKDTYRKLNSDHRKVGIHLAVFSEPFVSLLFQGQKKIESRFSVNRISPYQKVAKDDIIVVKKTGGPIVGFFEAGEVEYYNNLNTTVFKNIEEEYGKKIGSQHDPNFWESRSKANYLTLLHVEKLKEVEPYTIKKRDRMAWVVLSENSKLSLFCQDDI
jgi:hypothetical protein